MTVVIIGGGPAGISTAVQLNRHKIPCCLIEKAELGGLLKNAGWVENYPGFPQGITGPALVELFKQGLNQTETLIIKDEVLALSSREGVFYLTLSQGEIIAQIVVVASGSKARAPEGSAINWEARELVYSEIYSLLKVKEHKIVILGAGDAAFDYALSLAVQNQVVILNRSRRIRALPVLQEGVKNSINIVYRENVEISKVEKIPKGLLLGGIENGNEIKISCDCLITAIGRKAQLDFITDDLREVMPELQRQGVLYLAGDVNNQDCRQTAIAVGEGIKAAMMIKQKLERLKDENFKPDR